MNTIKKTLIALLAVVSLLYTGNASASLYTFFDGNLPSIEYRAKIYAETGKTDRYVGSLEQNIFLEKYLSENLKSKNFGATPFRPSGYSSTLASRLLEGGTETTLTVNSLTLPDGTMLNQNYYGDLLILTVDEGDNEEKIAVTTLASSTRKFTILERGLEYGRWATSSDNIKQHLPGALVYVSDDDHFLYQQYVAEDRTNVLTGQNTFQADVSFEDEVRFSASSSFAVLPTLPIGDPVNLTDAVSKNYADNIANAGAADSAYDQKGLSQLATSTQYGKKFGSTDARLVIPSEAASSTQSAKAMIPVTNSSGKVDATFLDLETESGLVVSSTKLQIDIVEGTPLEVDSEGLSFDQSEFYPAFGNASDGDVVISSSTHIVRDMYYRNLTIDSGKVLNPNGYRIFVNGILTNNGTISRAGSNGSNASGQTAGLGSTGQSWGTLRGGVRGGNGKIGAQNGTTGTAGDAGVSSTSLTTVAGGAGGTGGAGIGFPGSGAGGAAGVPDIETAVYSRLTQFSTPITTETSISVVEALITAGTSTTYLSSSAGAGGGGSGGADASSVAGGSGGAGGGGGIIYIAAKTIINNGVFTVAGGNGGNGGNAVSGNANGGGGGGGGAGGIIVLIYKNLTTEGTLTLSGGTGGTGGSGIGIQGLAGSNGSSGANGKYLKVKFE